MLLQINEDGNFTAFAVCDELYSSHNVIFPYNEACAYLSGAP